jgi:hypothetical protein
MALFFNSDDGESGQTQLNSIRFFLHRWYVLKFSPKTPPEVKRHTNVGRRSLKIAQK